MVMGKESSFILKGACCTLLCMCSKLSSVCLNFRSWKIFPGGMWGVIQFLLANDLSVKLPVSIKVVHVHYPKFRLTQSACLTIWYFNETIATIPVKAFMKVERDRLSILKNGSLTGYLSEPHRTVCSRIWEMPVLSIGVVLNPTLK